MNRKDILKNELSILQRELGVHFVTTRKLTSVDDCREAMVTIVKCFNKKDGDKLSELIQDVELVKRNNHNIKELMRKKEEEIEILKSENKKLKCSNSCLIDLSSSLHQALKLYQQRHNYYSNEAEGLACCFGELFK